MLLISSSEETLIGAATGNFTNIQVSQWDSNATYIGVRPFLRECQLLRSIVLLLVTEVI